MLQLARLQHYAVHGLIKAWESIWVWASMTTYKKGQRHGWHEWKMLGTYSTPRFGSIPAHIFNDIQVLQHSGTYTRTSFHVKIAPITLAIWETTIWEADLWSCSGFSSPGGLLQRRAGVHAERPGKQWAPSTPVVVLQSRASHPENWRQWWVCII